MQFFTATKFTLRKSTRFCFYVVGKYEMSQEWFIKIILLSQKMDLFLCVMFQWVGGGFFSNQPHKMNNCVQRTVKKVLNRLTRI